jgi:hypothetical protein
LFRYCKLLIINDSDTKLNLSGYLNSEFENEVQVIENGMNLGYARTFAKILVNCDTEYCLVMADDDDFVISGIIELSRKLGENDAAILVTQWIGRDQSPSKKLQIGRLSILDIRTAFNHAPGIVYRVSRTKQFVPQLEDELQRSNVLAQFFPQVLLAYIVSIEQPIHFVDIITGGYSEELHQKSDLTDGFGRGYTDKSISIPIELALIEFLSRLQQDRTSTFQKTALDLATSDIYFHLCAKIGSQIEAIGDNQKIYYAGCGFVTFRRSIYLISGTFRLLYKRLKFTLLYRQNIDYAHWEIIHLC